jgi:outer membrane protein
MKKILILIILISFGSLQAQKGVPQVFSLDDCIRIASEQNPDLKLARAGISSAQAGLINAFGNFLPGINFNMAYSRKFEDASKNSTIELPPGMPPEMAKYFTQYTKPNTYSMSANASLPIFNGFSREAQYSKAEKQLKSVELNIGYTGQAIRLEVYRQYINIIKFSQIVKIRKENMETGEKDLERIKAQFQAGVSAVGDVYAQEAEIGNRELEIVRTENDLNIAKANLLTTMGLKPDIEADFVEFSLPKDMTKEEIASFRSNISSYQSAVQKALDNRIDFAKSQNDIEIAETDVTSSKSGRYPNLSLSGGWFWSNSAFSDFSDRGSSSVSLNLSVPIFENFRTSYNIEMAELSLTQRQLEQVKIEQNIRGALRTQILNLDAAEKQLDITERSLKSAGLNYESAKEQYDVGVYSIIEYLNANYLYISAQINRINAVYNYFQAQKEVLFALGKLE